MRRFRHRFLWAALMLLASTSQAQPSWPTGFKERFSVKGRQPAATVGAAAIDKAGFLWLGTSDGLFRYDGSGFVHFHRRSHPNLIHNTVHLVRALKDGGVFVALGTGLAPAVRARGDLDLQKRPRPILRTLHNDTVEDVVDDSGPKEGWLLYDAAEDAHGVMWLATSRGLATVKDKRLRWGSAIPIFGPVHTLVFDGPTLWLGTPDGLARWHQNELQVRYAGVTQPVWKLVVDRGSRLWARLDDELLALNGPAATRHALPTPGNNDQLPTNLAVLAVDAHNAVWLADEFGLLRFGDGRFEAIGFDEGLLDPLVLHLVADPYGGVVAGTRAVGFVHFAPSHVRVMGRSQGLPLGGTRAVVKTRTHAIWTTTATGIGRIVNGHYEAAAWPSEFGSPTSLAYLTSADLLFVASNKGILRKHHDGFRLVMQRPTLHPLTLAWSQASDRLWAAWSNGEVDELEIRGDALRVIKRLGASEGLCTGSANAILASQDAVWVASSQGLSEITASSARCLGRKQGLKAHEITSLATDEQGRLWIGTRYDSGLFRRQGDGFVSLSEKQGLPCDSIHHLMSDARGHLWLACGAGIAQVRVSDLDAVLAGKAPRLEGVFFNRGDGVNETVSFGASPGLALDEDNRIWSTNSLGLVAIQDWAQPKGSAPQARIVSAQGSGKPLAPGTTIRGNSVDLQVKLSAAWLPAPHRLAFRHRLVGNNAAWIYTSNADAPGHVAYPDLSTGAYVFEAAASDGLRGWGKVTRLPFYVQQPFHRSPWFAGLLLLLAAMIGLSWHRARLTRAKHRYQLVLAERARIARDLHDTLAQGLTGASYHLQAIAQHHAQDNAVLRGLSNTATEILHSLHAQLKQAIWDLRHESADAGDLRAAARTLVARLRDLPQSPNVELHCDGALTVSAAQSHETLFVLQEAVVNAIRHAQAKHIVVWLRQEPHHVVMVVQDDGRGMPPPATWHGANEPGANAAIPHHFGIVGMYERARRMGGQLSFRRRPQGGTTVELLVPTATNPSSTKPL